MSDGATISNQREMGRLQKMDVIARAYRGEPLHRVALEAGDGVVYLISPLAAKADHPEDRAVGFPRRDVFRFDSELLANLTHAFQRSDSVSLIKLWQAAAPIQNDEAPSSAPEPGHYREPNVASPLKIRI